MQKIGDEKILLTFGHLEFQKLKVEALGLEKIFDKVFLVGDSKADFLESFISENGGNREIIFINDNYNIRFQENDEIRKRIPKIEIVEIDNYGESGNGEFSIEQFFLEAGI